MAIQTNWYKELLADLKKLEFTGIVLTKWNVGKRILEEFEKLGKPEYGNKRIENLAKDLEIKNSEFFMFLRVAITGKKISPPLNESMEALGKDNVLQRLKKVF